MKLANADRDGAALPVSCLETVTTSWFRLMLLARSNIAHQNPVFSCMAMLVFFLTCFRETRLHE